MNLNKKVKIVLITTLLLSLICVSPTILSEKTKKEDDEEDDNRLFDFFTPFENRTVFCFCHINSTGYMSTANFGLVTYYINYIGDDRYNREYNGTTTITSLLGHGSKQKILTGEHSLVIMGFMKGDHPNQGSQPHDGNFSMNGTVALLQIQEKNI